MWLVFQILAVFSGQILYIFQHHTPRYYLYSARFWCAKGCCVRQHTDSPIFSSTSMQCHTKRHIKNSGSSIASRFKMTFSARWLEINSHLGWSVLLRSVQRPSWQNTNKSKWKSERKIIKKKMRDISAFHLPFNLPVTKTTLGIWCISVSDATKICICVFSPSLHSISNVAPLQTTHPCGALTMSQIHHNAFDKTPVI